MNRTPRWALGLWHAEQFLSKTGRTLASKNSTIGVDWAAAIMALNAASTASRKTGINLVVYRGHACYFALDDRATEETAYIHRTLEFFESDGIRNRRLGRHLFGRAEPQICFRGRPV